MARLKTLDNYTYMHSVAVCGLMVALAKKLGHTPAQVHQAGMAGLLHDMGKAHMDLQILNKPGALTEAEFAQMKQHPVRGHAMLQTCVQDAAVLHACLHHHERLDGRGYPQGLAGDAIPLLTRMATICDIYDAITSDRPYKQAWSPGIALQRMSEWCGGHLDAQLFESFVKTMGIYPIGSLVRLQSGLLGVVCAPGHGLLPRRAAAPAAPRPAAGPAPTARGTHRVARGPGAMAVPEPGQPVAESRHRAGLRPIATQGAWPSAGAVCSSCSFMAQLRPRPLAWYSASSAPRSSSLAPAIVGTML